MANKIKGIGEEDEIESDFEQELDDKISDIIENEPSYFDNLDNKDNKEKVVN